MNDMIINAAQDPSCILAVTPDRGGSWWATLRPDTPRNFAENHTTWDSFQSIQEALDPTHDYTFEIEFECTTHESSRIFYNSATGSLFGLYHFRSGLVIFTTCLLGNTTTGDAYIEVVLNQAGSFLSGKHTAKMVLRGNTATVYMDGLLISTVSSESISRITPSNLSAPTSSAGYIYCIRLVDDTTGEIVWQASHDDLFETNNPWPSLVPRNFAEEPMAAWTDSYTAQDGIGTDDFTLSVDFTLIEKGGPGEINIGCMRCVYYNTTKGYQLSVRILKSDGTQDALYPVGTSHVLGNVASITVIKTGQNVRMVVYARDGGIVRDQTKPLPDGAAVTSSSGSTTYPGNISAASIRNDTTGRTVWSYPSEAERVRLITKTNVRTDRGAFEAADETQSARVDTALDLRGKVSSYTAVVDFEAIALDGTQSKMELAGQGASVTTGYPSICALAQSRASGNVQLSQEINGIRRIVYKAPDNQLGRHVAVGVVDVGNSSTRLAVYYDGGLLAEDTFDGIPAGTCDDRATNYALFDNRNGANTMRYGKIYSALLFDRALTAAEIAALCPTSN